MVPTSRHRRRQLRGVLASYVAACALVLGWIAWQIGELAQEPWAFLEMLGGEPEQRVKKGRQFVADPVVGLRPRRSMVVNGTIAALGGPPDFFVRHHNNLGLIRTEDLFEVPGRPRTLLVGDSHLMGVVSNHNNASDVLERSLRARPELSHAAVLNASCGHYSLYQQVLRARTLMDPLAPDVLVIAAFLGNDFLELEDVGRPHLDDAGREHPVDPDPPAETTTARRESLGLPAGDLIFWQGLNQACYFELHPERYEPVLGKARRCVELSQEMARERDLALVFALVPSYDLVFPERAAGKGARVAAVVAAGWNERLRDRFCALLAERGIRCVDVVDRFRADGRDALYATDYHLFVEGHRLLAEALLEPVIAALPAGRRD